MTKTLNKYWGKLLGGLINLYYFIFFMVLCCLIISDIYYFGKITLPETPGYIFIIFFLVPAVYGVKLGLEVVARLIEFLVPILVVIYCILLLLVFPKVDWQRILPIMVDGIKPILKGAVPNMNFPYAQVLPIAFYYKYTQVNTHGKRNFFKYTFSAIFFATILLNFRSLTSVAAFEEETLKTLTFPPFSTIRIIEIGEVIERLDPLLLAVFYATTYFKFILTFYIICEIISDYFQVAEPKDFALPVAILFGLSMPLLIPRFDIIIKTLIPYFLISLPLFFPIPLLLFATIKWKKRRDKKLVKQ